MRIFTVFVLAALTLASCGASSDRIEVIRLVDEFSSAELSGASAPATLPERTEWQFEEGADPGWSAMSGVSNVNVRGDRLTGRTTTDFPVIGTERTAGLDDRDVLHQVVIRARVSAGANLFVTFSRSEDPNVERMVERGKMFPWPLSTPIVAGDDVQTYTINTAAAARASFPASGIRHVFVRPTDAAGADFEIESIRLVFRKEHLAAIPAGVGWQGLSGVFRETIVTRSPEEASFTLTLPADPLLDLAVGTVEAFPVTFQVSVDDVVVLERTMTSAHQWERTPVDLAALGVSSGRDVRMTLSLRSDEPGAIGFWGAPAIRSRAPVADGRPQGVVVILMDTLRRDHLDAYGYPRETAPNIRRLAEEGVLFRDAIAQGAWTKVSVPSLLSSTYPSSNGIYELFHKLPASADTLAESFRAAGYATWAGSGNGFSGRGTNLHQGLEVLHESMSIEIPDGDPSSKNARYLTSRLLPWLEDHEDVPFFVYLHVMDPHSPYRPYPPYETKWGTPGDIEAHEADTDKVRPFIKSDFMKPMGLPLVGELEEAGIDPEAFVARELAMYDGATRAADAEIGRVLEKLRVLGLEDDTLVVFLSDHGEEFLDHGGHFHEENVYGELVNVPLVMRWPNGVPGGADITETVEILDVAPTILELAGLEKPERMQGDSLVTLLTTPERWTSRPAISEWTRRTDQRAPGQSMVDATSIILDGYKLVHNVERPEGVPEYELYDHAADPLDQNDVASEHPDVVERLASALSDWRKFAEANALPTDAESTEGLDAEELERLRSLGYVQ